MKRMGWLGRVGCCLSIVFVLGVSGCSLQPKVAMRDDPLIGRIFQASGEELSPQELSPEELIARASQADVIYLGEKHDNAIQHQIQLQVIRGMVDLGVKPALGFEFFDVGQTGLLMQYVQGTKSAMQLGHARSKRSAEEVLRERLGWAKRPDEDWGYYFALLALAKEAQLPVFGADLPRGIILRLGRAGREALNGVEYQQLTDSGLDHPDYRQLMFEAFTAAHCGWGEERMLEKLYQTWLARNDRMASAVVAMRERDPERPVVLVLGNGHIEYGMGVPERVQHLAPQANQLLIGLSEISREPMALQEYFASKKVGETLFQASNQFYWFTQRQDYDDPCAGMRTPSKS